VSFGQEVTLEWTLQYYKPVDPEVDPDGDPKRPKDNDSFIADRADDVDDKNWGWYDEDEDKFGTIGLLLTPVKPVGSHEPWLCMYFLPTIKIVLADKVVTKEDGGNHTIGEQG